MKKTSKRRGRKRLVLKKDKIRGESVDTFWMPEESFNNIEHEGYVSLLKLDDETNKHLEEIRKIIAEFFKSPYSHKFIVHKHGKPVAELSIDDNFDYKLTYYDGVTIEDSISITMPATQKEYSSTLMFLPIKQNIPEGYLRQVIIENIYKHFKHAPIGIDENSEWFLLAITGRNQIGGLSCTLPGDKPTEGKLKVSLEQLLRMKWDEVLYKLLMEQAMYFSGVAGIQPKILASFANDLRLTFHKNNYILKFATSKMFKHVILNEYISLKIAERIGLEVNKVFISDDHKMLVVERFDVNKNRNDKPYLFEEAGTLLGIHGKFRGDYMDLIKISKLLGLSLEERERLGKRVIVSMLLGDGDAHLKNFGFLYRWNGKRIESKVSPAYDIVATGVYDTADKPALNFMGSEFWPSVEIMATFMSKLVVGKSKKQHVKEIEDMAERILAEVENVEKFVDNLDEDEERFLESYKQAIKAHLGDMLSHENTVSPVPRRERILYTNPVLGEMLGSGLMKKFHDTVRKGLEKELAERGIDVGEAGENYDRFAKPKKNVSPDDSIWDDFRLSRLSGPDIYEELDADDDFPGCDK